MAETLAAGGSVDVSQGDLDAVDLLLADYQQYGSDSLREALDILRRDLRDQEILGELQVKVR